VKNSDLMKKAACHLDSAIRKLADAQRALEAASFNSSEELLEDNVVTTQIEIEIHAQKIDGLRKYLGVLLLAERGLPI